ncbi:MAG: SPOR domain-containing protein [Paramuribaculum sp.]|nr:SPOR domain-containing protein [Paramuribaculum sp.]
MALINCHGCGKKVSDKAKNCPHCGVEISEIKQAGSPSVEDGQPTMPITNEASPTYGSNDPGNGGGGGKKKLWLILVPLILIGIGVAIWVSVYQHKKAEELARIEQLRQDSIAAVEADRLRQDSLQAAKDERRLNIDDEYFLIVASFDLEENAENYISKQQAKLGLIEYDGHYRVFVASSNTLKEITQYKKKFEDTYPNAWIFHKKDPDTKSVKTTKTHNDSKQQATVSQNNRTSRTSDNEVKQWIQGNWKVHTRYGEARIGISGSFISVWFDRDHIFTGPFEIRENDLVYDRRNGSAFTIGLDRKRRCLMMDSNTPMYRF